jgi:hypothetical protein
MRDLTGQPNKLFSYPSPAMVDIQTRDPASVYSLSNEIPFSLSLVKSILNPAGKDIAAPLSQH